MDWNTARLKLRIGDRVRGRAVISGFADAEQRIILSIRPSDLG
jgi:hypothetical protein